MKLVCVRSRFEINNTDRYERLFLVSLKLEQEPGYEHVCTYIYKELRKNRKYDYLL